MKAYFTLTVLLVCASCASASFEEEMASLEAAMENDHMQDNVKKSIQDLSTEELIAELEKDLLTTKGVSEDKEKKYRTKFEEIINKKAKLDELVNMDIKRLVAKERGANIYEDLIKSLSDSLTEKKEIIDADKCVDKRSDCNVLKSFCQSHRTKLEVVCMKTCGICVECSQPVSTEVCEMLRKRGKCDTDNESDRRRMIILCPVTCNYCKVPSPPKCSATRYGCCWNKETTKTSAKGDNCPECTDKYKFVCKTFQPDCTSMMKPGEFMAEFCPKSCDMCDGNCADNRLYIDRCSFWSSMKWCITQRKQMNIFCAKTCNMC